MFPRDRVSSDPRNHIIESRDLCLFALFAHRAYQFAYPDLFDLPSNCASCFDSQAASSLELCFAYAFSHAAATGTSTGVVTATATLACATSPGNLLSTDPE